MDTMRIRVWLIASMLVIPALAADLPAQTGYTMKLPDVSGAPGTTVSVPLLIDITAEEIDGWSMGICSDPAVVDPTGATLGADVLPLAPDFVNIDTSFPGGLTYGVVISFAPPFDKLFPGLDLELLVIDYALVGTAGSSTALTPCSTLGDPPVALLVVASLVEIVPDVIPGQVTVASLEPTGRLAIPDLTASPGESITATVTLDHGNSDGVVGFSFGVEFDTGILTANSVLVGADLALVRGGSGPSFFGPNLAPAVGQGITLGCLTDFNQPPSLLPVGTNLALVDLNLTVSPTAPANVVTPLTLSDQLGDPRTIIEVVSYTNGASTSILPTLDSGSVDLSISFVRGDANRDGVVSILDAVRALELIFLSTEPLTCPDELDVDDDGITGILDAVRLLEFLFLSGSPPSAPFPACGVDPTATDLISCDSTAPACP